MRTLIGVVVAAGLAAIGLRFWLSSASESATEISSGSSRQFRTKSPLRIHFLFMRATVGQDAQSWLPDNSMEGWICLSPLSKPRSAPRTLRR
jgi:hypothetical protein